MHFYNNNIDYFYNNIFVLDSIPYWIFFHSVLNVLEGGLMSRSRNNPWTLSTVWNCFVALQCFRKTGGACYSQMSG